MEKLLKKYGSDFITNGSFKSINITADTHFRHDNVIKFEQVREELRIEEGFNRTPDEFLIHTWNKQVDEDDLTLVLGDISWKSFQPIRNKLNGTILLILGNHDKKA